MDTIAKRVGVAAQLEAQNAQNEAFIEYLGCMCQIAQQLSQSKGILLFASTQPSFENISQSVSALYAYARQCLDHSETILKKEIEEMQEKKLGYSIGHTNVKPQDAPTSSAPRPASSRPASGSNFGTSPSSGSLLGGEEETKIGGVKEEEEADDGRKKIQSAMHEAQQNNLVLLQKYQSRVDKLKMTYGESNPTVQAQLSDLSLKFSREYAENYQIAKNKQESILNQIESRQKNIKTLQRLSVENEHNNKGKAFKVLSRFKQDTKAVRICREMDAEWRKLLAVEGVSEKVVLPYLGHILGLGTHPLGKEAARLVDESEALLSALTPTHDPDLFKEKIHSVRNMLNAVEDMVLGTYTELDTKAGQDAVRLCVDLVLFPRVFPTLFDWFLQKTKENDALLDKKVQIFAAVQPAHIGVRKMFWLLEEKPSANAIPPYQRAIDILRRLSSITTTSSKLHCLIDTSKAVVDCASKFWDGKLQPGQLVIGADDLVPIIAFVIIKAAVRNMHAEISLVEEFMDESQMIGEAGYCLSTFQTCLFYIQSLDWREADQQHTDLQK